MREIKTRLRHIADYINRKRGRQLNVLFRVFDGSERAGTVDDLIAAKGTFIRVLSGNNMDDLDQMLHFELGNIHVMQDCYHN